MRDIVFDRFIRRHFLRHLGDSAKGRWSQRSSTSPQPTEPLEVRRLLSSTPVVVATPDDVAVNSTNGLHPLTTAGPTGYTPAQIIQAYGFNQVSFGNGVAGNGAGTTIAIVDAYDDPNIAHDLHQFDLAFGLPDPQLTKVNETGGSAMPAANSIWITEIALDVEWSHAIAPAANILLVEANSASLSDLMTAVNYARQAAGVVVVSMSWGAGEFAQETTIDSNFTTPAGHSGVSFVVASGDGGSPVSYPAASPNVLAVGGTSLYLSPSGYSSESGWSGSGGGISSIESQPAYQNGVVTQSTTQRTNPDVSYDSDPNTGYPVYDSYNNGTVAPWGQWGGTSAAAPQWSALIAIADQGRILNGQGSLDGSNQLLPDIYQLPSADFHDVTTGSSLGNPVYSAGPGYDLVTGRGTPIANLVIPGLMGTPKSTAPTHFNLSLPTSVAAGQTFSVTVSALNSSNGVCGSYLGTVQFSTTDQMAGVVLPSSYTFTASDGGVHTFTGLILKTAGSQSITVQDRAASTLSGSATVTVSLMNSPPTIGGTTSLNYVKNQAATAICPTIWLSDSESTTIASATVKITNFVAADDVLSFVNNNSYLYGNVSGVFNSVTGTLTLTSTGATAAVWQFQAALRAVSYFNQSGNNAVMGTRTVAFQVSDGFNVSQPATAAINLSNDNTITSLSSSAVSIGYGQAVNLVATISVVSPGAGIPSAGTGSSKVTFFDGGSAIAGSVTYAVSHGALVATLTTSTLNLGTHSVTAVYSGDANDLGSVSAPLNVKVIPVATSSVITSSTTWPYYGAPLTLTAVISAANRGSLAPAAGAGIATVTFQDGANIIPGTVTYSTSNGTLIATLTTSNLTAALHLITAVYSGNSQFVKSIAAPMKQVVLDAVTSTSLSSSTTTTPQGQLVTLTAVIGIIGAGAGLPTAGSATANVKFMEGSIVLTGTVKYSVVNGKLVATLTTTSLKPGAHSIKAVYSGDVNYSSSMSNTLNLQISG